MSCSERKHTSTPFDTEKTGRGRLIQLSESKEDAHKKLVMKWFFDIRGWTDMLLAAPDCGWTDMKLTYAKDAVAAAKAELKDAEEGAAAAGEEAEMVHEEIIKRVEKAEQELRNEVKAAEDKEESANAQYLSNGHGKRFQNLALEIDSYEKRMKQRQFSRWVTNTYRARFAKEEAELAVAWGRLSVLPLFARVALRM